MGELTIEVAWVRALRFDDGTPVRAASGVARLGWDWLIVQDDGTHAAWRRGSSMQALRLFPPVGGHDFFSPHDGTKQLKPDLESACSLIVDRWPAVLVLGSGSAPNRCRGALVVAGADGVAVHRADLTPLYQRAAAVLGLAPAQVNFEGACLHQGALRWFNRGLGTIGIPSASVDVDLPPLLSVLREGGDPARVGLGRALRYDLGTMAGVVLAVTDAVALTGGRILLSAAAEDTPNSIDDGPVVGTTLSIVADDQVLHHGLVPPINGTVAKIEGLALHDLDAAPDGSGRARVMAVVDADDPDRASSQILLRLRWD